IVVGLRKSVKSWSGSSRASSSGSQAECSFGLSWPNLSTSSVYFQNYYHQLYKTLASTPCLLSSAFNYHTDFRRESCIEFIIVDSRN
ncbi:unnamed protein product, partial [Amoebophrya sp. A25]